MSESKPKLKVLDLFSGILVGGFSLGLERTGGFSTVAFCEIEPFPRRVLARHWPGVPCYDDVRTLTGARLAADGIAVDVITGGFPCQDLSVAGKQRGMGEGTRSGLWSEIVRLIGELRPRYVIVENVAALLDGPSERRGGWFGRVLGDLAELGLHAEWASIPAAAVGGPHIRERVWLVAYADCERSTRLRGNRRFDGAANPKHDRPEIQVRKAHYDGLGRSHGNLNADGIPRMDHGLPAQLDGYLSGKNSDYRPAKIMPSVRGIIQSEAVQNWPFGGPWGLLEAQILRAKVSGRSASQAWGDPQADNDVTGAQAQVGVVRKLRGSIKTAHSPLRPQHSEQQPGELGDPLRALPQPAARRSDRIKALGNAVVPQIPELIGRAILQAEARA
jgi:DNA (cytosine-5)-methyltransferase 1